MEAIALDLGYASPSQFSRAFKLWTGQSPSQFRRDAIAREQG
ncbi:MAG: helix-turn-helix domain-containing protein [Spirulina sp.]